MVYAWPILFIWYATWLLSVEKNVLALKRHPGVEGVCKGKIFAYMLWYVSFPLICYATWLLSEKKLFWPFDPIQGLRVHVRAKALLVCCPIFHSLEFDMQHDHILKRLIFTRVKVTVTQKWYMKLLHLKMHPHTKFEIPISINIGDMLRTLLI